MAPACGVALVPIRSAWCLGQIGRSALDLREVMRFFCYWISLPDNDLQIRLKNVVEHFGSVDQCAVVADAYGLTPRG